MNSGYVQSAGARIYFEINDERNDKNEKKPVLVLLHGNNESMDYFEKQRKFFGEKYSVLCIDSRGHGQSGFGGDLNFNTMAEDVYAVLNSLRIPKANILGFSDGANIAMIFAYTHPERVDRLVLAGGNMTPGGCKTGFRIPIIISYWLCCLAAKLDEKSAAHRDIIALMVKEPKIKEADVKKIQAETLVIVGKKDMIKLSHTKKIAGLIENSELIVIDGADHFAIYDKAAEFNGIVSDFFDGN